MITKICKTCRVNKPLDEYHVMSKSPDGHQYDCRVCFNKKKMETYFKKSEDLFEYKGGKCAHCDLRDLEHPEIYDYHHIDPATKIASVKVIMGCTLEKVRAEADKCLLLCANCHRKEHARMKKETKANEPQPKQEEHKQEEAEGQTVQYMLC